MKKNFNKYKRHYSYIFLGAYLFLISLTIFHYHHYDFWQGNYNLEQTPQDQSTNPFDKFFNLTGECIVSHFINTIDNISYVPILTSESINSEIYFSLCNRNKIPKQEFNYKHHLRAPPSI